jgi:hypothetical protein
LLPPVKPKFVSATTKARLLRQALSSLRMTWDEASPDFVLADGTLNPRVKFDLIRHRTGDRPQNAAIDS